jgi:lipopolysaccharide transport system permease protein
MTAILELTRARLKARYRRTLAGFFWVLMSPMITFGAQAFVFSKILRLDVSHYLIFLLGGILPWIFLTASIEMGIPALQGSRDLMMAYRIHPGFLILSSILDNWVNFLAGMAILLIPALIVYKLSPIGLLFLPVALIQLFLGTSAIVWLLAVLNIFFRDTRFLAHFCLNILFFITPIFYPREFIPAAFQWMVDVNPLYAIIEPVRACLYHFNIAYFFSASAKGVMVTLGLAAISILNWRRSRNEFYFQI